VEGAERKGGGAEIERRPVGSRGDGVGTHHGGLPMEDRAGETGEIFGCV
jgi:hypothetical protein